MKTKDAIHQLEQNIQKLGIIDIQAYDGELSLDIVQDALNSTQKLLNSRKSIFGKLLLSLNEL